MTEKDQSTDRQPAADADAVANNNRSPSSPDENVQPLVVDSSVKTQASTGSVAKSFWFTTRMGLAVIMFGGVFFHAVLRSVLSMSMVCMVNMTAIRLLNNETQDFSASNRCEVAVSDVRHEYDGSFIWDSAQQNLIFGALGWGSVLGCLPSGYIADKHSIKLMFTITTLIASLCTLLTPLAASWGYGAMIFVRFVLGLTQGTIWPTQGALISRWIPANERASISGIITGGNQIAMVVAMPFSAWMCGRRDLLGGWPCIYYVSGCAMLLWLIIFVFYVTDSPSEHRRMDKEEMAYIKSHLGTELSTTQRRDLPTPWRAMMTSPAVWSVLANHCAASWSMHVLIIYLPAFLRDVMQIHLKSNGLYSAAPFLSLFVLKLIFSRAADVLRQRIDPRHHSFVMKLFNTLGMVSLAAFQLGGAFVGCGQSLLSVMLLATGTGLFAAVTPGFMTAMMLIAPRYGGILAAISTMLANSVMVVLPIFVSVIVRRRTAEEWRIIFGIGSGTSVVAAILFAFFASADEQEWAKLRLTLKTEQLLSAKNVI